MEEGIDKLNQCQRLRLPMTEYFNLRAQGWEFLLNAADVATQKETQTEMQMQKEMK